MRKGNPWGLPFFAMDHRRLFWGIMIGAMLGFALGTTVGHILPFCDLLGALFLNALKGMVVPLVMASLNAGIAGLGQIQQRGRVGTVTLIYYMVTNGSHSRHRHCTRYQHPTG